MQKLLSLLLVAAMYACQSKNAPAPDPYAANSLEGKTWQLTLFAVGPEPRGVQAGTTVTIKFEGGKIEGHGGCNGYGATYVLNVHQLSINNITATEMYCDNASEQESRFFEQLRFAQRYSIRGEILEIDCGDMGNLVFRLNEQKQGK